MEGLTAENSTMGSGTSSSITQEENACISPQAQGRHNQKNECISSDENIVIIYLVSWLFHHWQKRPCSILEDTSCLKLRYQNMHVARLTISKVRVKDVSMQGEHQRNQKYTALA